ncbi:glycosyltransferase family 4 protein [Sphingobium yanoikuyae]|uniref:Glycosyltransferase family 4 protein n=1 Tax=Sphingobium yanoikuyae TaxID=13690 RepID=A0A9X7YGC4_SPHYA|nr:glycosyltransferase family 4 protein [Sphingobium yanoikuyae]QNG49028.1 glycosyltransferase family 4 protein [Sphingobium yanoikuyae]
MIGLRSIGSGQGGVEAHVDHLTRELDALGLRVEVVTRSPYQSERMTRGHATSVVPVWSPRATALEALVHSALATLRAAWRRPVILHIHAIGPSLMAPFARLLGLKVVVTHHGEDYAREKWGRTGKRMLRLGEWCGARFAHARIVVSSSLAERLSQSFKVPFFYLPNGVSVRGPVAGTGTLKAFGLEPGKYILNVSRIVPEKRQLDLIDALGQLGRDDMKLLLVGSADHESDYSRTVNARANAHPQVVLAGFQTGQPLAELFSHAGAFALPSSHEGLPIALLEAMAYGNPVVASAIEANRNVALPAHCYVPCADVPALSAALARALNEGAGGKRIDWSNLIAQYSWPDIAERTAAIYHEVDSSVGMRTLPGMIRPNPGREGVSQAVKNV